MSAPITGYRRADGRAGVRNHVLVLPVRAPANPAVTRIARGVPGCVCVTHDRTGHEAGDADRIKDTLVGFATNPNVAAVLLVGVNEHDEWLADAAAGLGQDVTFISLAAKHGLRGTVQAGQDAAAALVGRAQIQDRVAISWADLILGLECGGSDGLSGLTANPALGVATDLIVAAGGSAILAETPELIGAEDALARRGVSAEVSRRVRAMIEDFERSIGDLGVDVRGAQPTPGNQEGGLTTIEEKALGSAKKGGSAPIVDVLRFAERVRVRGLSLMDTPGQDIEQMVAMAAGGAQIVAFTTGRGTPTGSPILPCIKIATNSALAARMGPDIDINAGAILDGQQTIPSMGARIFERVRSVACGETTAAERGGHTEFALSRTVPA